MTENESGQGRLVSLAADQTTFTVDYELTVDTQTKGSSATFDPVKVVKNYSLKVTPRGVDKIRDGEYTLKTKNETLRVRKVGSRWVVIQP